MTTPYVRPSHEDGIAKAQAIAEEFSLDWFEIRQIAADHLSRDWPAEEGMGSSDVSCHLSSLANYEDYVLREGAAQRAKDNAFIDEMRAASGKSREEFVAGMRKLFAPA